MTIGRPPRTLATALLGGWLAACGGATKGAPERAPNPPFEPDAASVVTVRRSETDSFDVLWNGPVNLPRSGARPSTGAWVAGDHDALNELWQNMGLSLPAPAVDFGRRVVFGVSREGGACPGRIESLAIERGEVLRLRGTPSDMPCLDSLEPVAQVVAVPRRLLGSKVVLVPFEYPGAYAFSVPGGGQRP